MSMKPYTVTLKASIKRTYKVYTREVYARDHEQALDMVRDMFERDDYQWTPTFCIVREKGGKYKWSGLLM